MNLQSKLIPPVRQNRTSKLAWVLIVLGALSLLGSTFTLWARTTLFSSTGFSSRAREALSNKDVRAFMADRIVGKIIEHGSNELLTVRPLLESVVESLLATESFSALYGATVEDLHRTIFERDQDTVILGMSDAMIVLMGVLQKLKPDIAANFPADMQSFFVTISERNYAVDLAQFVENVSFLAYVLPVLALLAFALAVRFSHDSRRALKDIGTVAAVASVVAIGALHVGRQIMMAGLGDVKHLQAAAGVWDIFTAPLHNWLWITAIVGVLFSAVMSSAFSITDARATLQWMRSLLAEGPTTGGGRLLYGVLSVALGALLLARPELMLRLTVRSLGLVVLYFGIVEVGRVVRSGGILLVVRLGRFAFPIGVRAASFAALAVVTAVAGGLVWQFFAASEVELPGKEVSSALRCNGYEALCDRPLNEVAFAATHNSMSAASEPGWFFASHDRGIPDQLAAGIRGFLIDTHYGFPVDQGVRTYFAKNIDRGKLEEELGEAFVQAAERLAERWNKPARESKPRPYLCHGFCELGATDLVEALTGIRQFLERNPHEVIILFFEDYISPDDTALAFEKSGLIQLVYTHVPGSPWPTLRRMIEENKRVLVLSEGKFGNLERPPWYHDGFELVQDTPYRFHSVADFSCRRNRGRPASPLFLINHWIEKVAPSPADAEHINRFDILNERVLECRAERNRFPNLVAVNFYARGDLHRVVNDLNRVRKSSEKRPADTGK